MAILVIGLGSQLRRDDGVGRAVAESLSQRHPEWAVVSSIQLLPEHAQACAAADEVFIVDAARDVPVGEVQVRDLERTDGGADQPPRTHRFGPEQILQMARAVFGRAGRARLVCLGCDDFRLSEGLSPSAQRAADAAIDRIEHLAEETYHARAVTKPVHP